MFDDVRNGENNFKSNFNVESGDKYYVKILLRENGFQAVSNSVSHRIHITHIQLIESTIAKWHTKSFVLIECTPNLHCQVKILSDLLQYHYNPIFQFPFMYPRISAIHFNLNWDPFSMVCFIYFISRIKLKIYFHLIICYFVSLQNSKGST